MTAGFPEETWTLALHSHTPCCSSLLITVIITTLITGNIYGTSLSDGPCAKCLARYYLI